MDIAVDSKPEENINKITSLDDLDAYLSETDNSINTFHISEIPECCKQYPCILGIDEAGRGPVLGPMVYGTAFCPINEMAYLDTLGCADSKILKEETRDTIFTSICQSRKLGWAVEVISPNSISNGMLGRRKHSLNQISMDAAVKLIEMAAKAGVQIEHIYVDTVGPPDKYQAYLHGLFPKYKITVSKKADSLYTIVSAASICAKVTRDHSLQVWKFPEGLPLTYKDFGSGYPGDPTTKKFLVNHCDPVFGFPQLVRFSWSTATNALKNVAYHVEWDDDDDEDEAAASAHTTPITSFFKFTSTSGKIHAPKKRHNFFTQRCLERTTEL